MTTPLRSDTMPRFDPHLIEAATRHAHALRRQAIDDAFRQLSRWLSQAFVNPGQAVVQEPPCHS
jgi:hypothetical protein